MEYIIGFSLLYSIIWVGLYFGILRQYNKSHRWSKWLTWVFCPLVLFPILILLVVGLFVYVLFFELPHSKEDAKRKLSRYQTDKKLERCEAFRGIDFPEFTPLDTMLSAAFLMEEYMISHHMRFNQVPNEQFYRALDDACLNNPSWSKSEDGTEYRYDYIWSADNLHNGPDGWDYLTLVIRRGERDFELSYGTE